MDKLKFLVDVGVGRQVEQCLREDGHDVKAVRDIDPCMKDADIIRLAAWEKRIIITMDKDFGELVYHSLMRHCGVLLLRLEDAAAAKKVQVVQHILANHAALIKDSFCVFQNDKFRIRKINRIIK
jgi:predicted nuclease of predicted toxin-antitoxin system